MCRIGFSGRRGRRTNGRKVFTVQKRYWPCLSHYGCVCVFRPLSVATRCLRTTNDGHLWFRFYVMPLVWSVCSILFSLSCQRALVPTGAKWNFLARINTHRKGSKGRQRRKTKKRQRTHNHDSPPDLPLCRDCLPLSGRSLYELLGY